MRKGKQMGGNGPSLSHFVVVSLAFWDLGFSSLCFCLLLAHLHFLAKLLVDIEGGVDPADSANSSQTQVMKAADLAVSVRHITPKIYC